MPGVPTNRELRSCPWTAGCMIAALAFPAGDALAISRYNSASMTCSAIHDTLNRERAVILRYSTLSSGERLFTIDMSLTARNAGVGRKPPRSLNTSR